jgi:hypothetical protein
MVTRQLLLLLSLASLVAGGPRSPKGREIVLGKCLSGELFYMFVTVGGVPSVCLLPVRKVLWLINVERKAFTALNITLFFINSAFFIVL